MSHSFINEAGETLAGAFLITVCIVFRPLLRPWYSKWGATEFDLTQKLPGDEYVPSPRGGYTQAIGIKASANSIWPWLVQVGQDRGGFYSYQILENMVGCNIHNTDCILTEHQSIKTGDSLIMHPKAPAVPVTIIEPEKALVFGGRQDENTANVWTFFIMKGDGSTRLISRWAFSYKPGLLNRVAYNWFLEPIAAVMQRKMLLGIKERIEMVTQ